MWKCASVVFAATVQMSLGLQCDGLEDRATSNNIWDNSLLTNNEKLFKAIY